MPGAVSRPSLRVAERPQLATAVVYCEANFGDVDGKTANGLVRHSERYDIVAVIDSHKAGLDSGDVLDDKPNAIPICFDLEAALAQTDRVPDYFIFGIAPSSGMLSPRERGLVLEAIGLGMDIVSGLHEFLADDLEFAAAAAANGVLIRDVRKPRATKDLRVFSGRIAEVDCPRIAVLGTDCAIGKRTTATILTQALQARGLKAVMIGTGQTGLMQGARYGVALDAVPTQFCAGELEATVVHAYHAEKPDVIIIEGQGALSHPAYSTSSFILRGSCPQAVVLQHAPGRAHRCDFPSMAMPEPGTEIESHRDLRRDRGHRPDHQPREHGRRTGQRRHRSLRARARPGHHGRADAVPRRTRGHGLLGLPGALREDERRDTLGTPRLEIDLAKIEHNADVLVGIWLSGVSPSPA